MKNWEDREGFGLRVVNCGEVTRNLFNVCLYRFLGFDSSSLVIRMSFSLQRGYLSHGSFVSCFQEAKGGSERPSWTWCFSCAFNSKQLVWWSGLFWGDMFWTSPSKSYNMYLSVILTWYLYFILCFKNHFYVCLTFLTRLLAP